MWWWHSDPPLSVKQIALGSTPRSQAGAAASQAFHTPVGAVQTEHLPVGSGLRPPAPETNQQVYVGSQWWLGKTVSLSPWMLGEQPSLHPALCLRFQGTEKTAGEEFVGSETCPPVPGCPFLPVNLSWHPCWLSPVLGAWFVS